MSNNSRSRSYGIDIGDLTLWNPTVPGETPGLILSTVDEDGKVIVYAEGKTHTVNWTQVRPIYRIDGTKVTYEDKKVNT